MVKAYYSEDYLERCMGHEIDVEFQCFTLVSRNHRILVWNASPVGNNKAMLLLKWTTRHLKQHPPPCPIPTGV